MQSSWIAWDQTLEPLGGRRPESTRTEAPEGETTNDDTGGNDPPVSGH